MPPVPGITQVVRGALVNIVLKADQPTGRTVAGAIQDVLTRGNHPRGIKVRLTDGRVGRVKSLASAAQVRGEEPPTPAEPGVFGRRRSGSRERARSIWAEGSASAYSAGQPTTEVGLDAYLRPAKTKGRGKGRSKGGDAVGQRDLGDIRSSALDEEQTSIVQRDPALTDSQLSVCPVCLEFEGDEQAVSHHVGLHFE
ncbi:hypothetical protein BROUX41_000209 [Berkeleyomyces rouxiae]|uniref:uncharacterized protein n=1 Tax=Berkeleyomyces rouxiae TaxID=2035830 RepID=UPI003B814CCD